MTMTKIRFIRDAKEQRVDPGIPGHKDQTKRKDRNYEILHRAGSILEVKPSTATHWIARGVAEEITGDGGDGEPVATLPPAPGSVPLPPPPGV